MDEDYRRFILEDEDSVVRHWVKKGTSGWRLDVADELPMPFLRELRKQVKDVSPNAAVLGEVWEDASHKVAYGQMRVPSHVSSSVPTRHASVFRKRSLSAPATT